MLMGYLQSTAKQQPNIFLLDGNVCWAWQKEHLYQDFTFPWHEIFHQITRTSFKFVLLTWENTFRYKIFLETEQT